MFARETDLQMALKDLELAPLFQGGVTLVRREIPLGGCIPDAVFIWFRSGRPTLQWARQLSYRQAHLLATLRRHGPLSAPRLAAIEFEGVDRIWPSCNALLRLGALEATDEGLLRVAIELDRIDVEVVAVEAKISRWRSALVQAVAYKRFSHRSFVAMDHDRAPRGEEVLGEFRRAGVGLVAVGQSCSEWLVMPDSRSNPTSAEYEYLVGMALTKDRQGKWLSLNAANASLQGLT